MKRRRKRIVATNGSEAAANGAPPGGMLPDPNATTGRYIVTFREDAFQAGVSTIGKVLGTGKVARTGDFKQGAVKAEELESTPALVFDKLGIAVVSGEPEQMGMLAAAGGEEGAVLAVEPERLVHVLAADPFGTALVEVEAPPAPVSSRDYLRGYRDAVEHLYRRLAPSAGGDGVAEEIVPAAVFSDTAAATWGLQATRVLASRFSGRGIRVAVLDTGLDLQHPDFAGRSITSHSFVAGQTPQDGHGHGTHCIGTACGAQRAALGRRYGIAHGAAIYAGKVLSNQGSGGDAGILAGINWAISNQCRVVSMSLGRATSPGEPFSTAFETAARRGLAQGTLIVAAAGNDSQRNVGIIRPVSHPANCPSILAVAALDSGLLVANFSNRGVNPNGGRVNISGPGVNVYSAWPMPTRNRTISGTSMATPHVAGIAALFSEANGGAGGAALWQLVAAAARPLSQSSMDVGLGLVQAP